MKTLRAFSYSLFRHHLTRSFQAFKSTAQGSSKKIPMTRTDAFKTPRETQTSTFKDFEDHEKIFKNIPARTLLKGYLVLLSCRSSFLVNNAERLLSMSHNLLGKSITNYFVKKTFFTHFCAGENKTEVESAASLLALKKVTPILDYSVETAPDSSNAINERDQFEANLENKLKNIQLGGTLTPGSFVPIKLTAFINPEIFVKLSKLLDFQELRTRSFFNSLETDEFQEFILSSNRDKEENIHQWFREHKSQLSFFFSSLERIVSSAIENNIKLLIDAEHFCLQSSIDVVAAFLSMKYNIKDAIIFNTFQCYLKSSTTTLDKYLRITDEAGVYAGCKLVRGAYMNYERDLSSKLGVDSPIHDTLLDTNQSFDSSFEAIYSRLEVDDAKLKPSVVLATHNKESLQKSLHMLEQREANDTHIYFAQLFGMGDNLTYTLSEKNLQAFKLVPYGAVDDVMPYLIRRAQENGEMINKTKQEQRLMMLEMKRRSTSLFKR
eukprot:maker-scaffold_12-snap-gene-9.2-mRNA-1 protein AED:0.19 eAED:0.19 QI:0/0/0/0.5/1/1/2/0/492